MMCRISQIIFIALIMIYNSAFAKVNSIEHDKTYSKTETLNNNLKQIYVSPHVGFRHDFLQWSFGFNGISKLSELTWKNKIAEVGAEILTKPEDNQINFLGSIKYGKILDDSESQDSDWDKLGEFSRTFSKVKGNTFDFSGAIGISQDRYSKFPYAFITHYFGFDYNYNNNEQFGLISEIDRVPNTYINLGKGEVYSKSKLISTYKYHNYAPWYGINFHYNLNNKLSFAPFIKAYLFRYNAEARWALRDDFAQDPSFIHKAFGAGMSVDAKLLYKATNSLDIYGNIGIKKLGLINGTETTFFSDGTSVSVNLKELKIITKTLSIGAKYKL